MSDQEKCIRETQAEIARAAEIVALAAMRLDHLSSNCFIPAQAAGYLPGELRGGLQAVRSDLLCDALDTLNMLAHMSEDDAMRRRAEIADLAARLSADV